MGLRPEAKIKKKILEYLNSLPDTYAFTVEQRPGQSRGVSDVLMVRAGKFYAVEVKVPGNKPTALQERFLSKVREAGGKAFWVTSVEQLEEEWF